MANYAQAQLTARPKPGGVASLAAGLYEVPAGGADTKLYLPPNLATPAPLLVSFHGATQTSGATIRVLQEYADRWGVAVLAPGSRGRTWDVLEGGFGVDVEALDAALEWVFERIEVEAERLGASGFSDGASYALSLAVANGELFRRAIAWSPGFIAAPVEVGRPRILVTHGTRDQILSIDRCSRRLVPKLRDGGYEVDYIEFDGPHTVPPELTDRSFEWFLEG